MRENKEKTITSRDKDVTAPPTAPPVVQVTSVQTGKRKSKSISSAVDLDDLPSRRGAKKQKPVKTFLPKVPKFTPSTVNLDDPSVDVEPAKQSIPSRLILLPLQSKILASLIRPSHLIVLLTWRWTRATHGGCSKESSLSMKSMNATTCQ